jgi:hypothetical protein
MLQLYWGALAFGGTLLVASLVLGASQKDLDKDVDGGPDKDLDKDLDKDVDGGLDKDVGADLGLDWLPVTSLRFWTFLLAFGGATGVLLTYAGSVPALAVGGLALGVGWASGVGMVATLRMLRRNSASSDVSSRDLRGETAEVTVALARGEIGKIRVTAKGRVLDLIAETDDAAPLPVGARVMILGEGAEGRVQVTRPDTN